jgi:hypothetical protein
MITCSSRNRKLLLLWSASAWCLAPCDLSVYISSSYCCYCNKKTQYLPSPMDAQTMWTSLSLPQEFQRQGKEPSTRLGPFVCLNQMSDWRQNQNAKVTFRHPMPFTSPKATQKLSHFLEGCWSYRYLYYYPYTSWNTVDVVPQRKHW